MSSPGRRRTVGSGTDVAERGQATVEFALVLPFVLLLVVGIVEVARLTALQVGAVDAARAGARAASTDPTAVSARAAVEAQGSSVPMTVDTALVDGPPRMVTVRVAREVRLVPGLGWSSVVLHASATMAVEDPP